MEKPVLTKKERLIDLFTKIGLSSAIVIILFLLATFLYFPKLSYKMYRNNASFSGLTGYDAALNTGDLLITQKEEFDDLQGKLIVFDLKGRGDYDGRKAYRALSYVTPIDGESYYIVGSTFSGYSFPWRITEDMYLGTVKERIPGIGAITGFLGSQESIFFYVSAFVSIGGIVILVKSNKISKTRKKENQKNPSDK